MVYNYYVRKQNVPIYVSHLSFMLHIKVSQARLGTPGTIHY